MDKTIRFAVTVLLVLTALAASAADQQSTRQQASRALVNADPAARRAAASQLAEFGRMSDVAALVKALRDRDEETRAAAERSIWQIWGRSGDAEVDLLYQREVNILGLVFNGVQTDGSEYYYYRYKDYYSDRRLAKT